MVNTKAVLFGGGGAVDEEVTSGLGFRYTMYVSR